jgi:hypothetical protein
MSTCARQARTTMIPRGMAMTGTRKFPAAIDHPTIAATMQATMREQVR